MASIADQYGFFWETIWNHGDNADLRKKRKNPNILFRGDEVVIPDLTERIDPAADKQKHTYKRKGVPVLVSIQLLRGREPRGNVQWECDIQGKVQSGNTDADGWLELKVPPRAERGLLLIKDGESEEEMDISFGHLDPIDEVEGVQKRLANLGIDCPLSGTMDERTEGALREFQRLFDLEVTGELNDETRDKLEQTSSC